MSKMYGPKRVVLERQPTLLGNYLVVVCGSDSPSANYPGTGKKGGDYCPMGYWYKENGLFYVDLKSDEQLYSSVNRETIAHKRLAGVSTQKALREFVMAYYNRIHEK